MKKNIIIVAIATLALAMTACQKEENIVNPGNNSNNEVTNTRVKSTSDLHNTNWNCSVSVADFLTATGFNIGCVDSIDDAIFESYLNFDGTYAHFTFSQNVEIWGLDNNDQMQQMQGIDYEYSYDGASHTGYLVGQDDNGNVANLTFTYDDNTDAITFVLPLYLAEDTANVINFPLVYNRAN